MADSRIRDFPTAGTSVPDTAFMRYSPTAGDDEKITGANFRTWAGALVQAALDAHTAATTSVHGIADTSALLTSVDLDYTPAASGGTVTNTAGTDAVVPDADSSNAGLMVPADFDKLASITVGDLLTQDGAAVDDLYVGVGTDSMSKVDGNVAVGDLYTARTKAVGAAVTYEVQDVADVVGTHEWATTTPNHVDTMTGDTTFSFGAITAGLTWSMFVQIFGPHTPTLPTVTWIGAEPTYASGTAYTFWSHDGGVTVYATGLAPA